MNAVNTSRTYNTPFGNSLYDSSKDNEFPIPVTTQATQTASQLNLAPATPFFSPISLVVLPELQHGSPATPHTKHILDDHQIFSGR
jgi:hypothetical protein